MLKLYTSAGSCSMASHIALQEAGIPFEIQMVDFDSGFMETKEVVAMNPKGYVPFISIDSEKVLTEGSAILQYIAEQAPDKNLFPTKGMERFKALEMLNYTATEIHKTIGGLFMAETLVKDEAARKEYVATVHGLLKPKFELLNTTLSAKKFILGDQYSVVDAYLFVVSWTKHLDINLAPYANIVSYQGRVFERPATQRAMKTEGLI